MATNNLFNLEGKTALVTGAGSGIGKEIAKTLYEAGANLALAARRRDKLEETKSDIKSKEHKVQTFSLDVTEETSINECLENIYNEFSSIDILVNNAGMTVVGTLDSNNENDWNNVINTNLRGPWALSKYWLNSRLKKSNKGGVILNVSSITGEAVQKGNGVYAISKAALSHITRQMALEWAKYDLRVNAIAPGEIETSMVTPKSKKMLTKNIPMNRFGTPEEVAGVIHSMCSDTFSYVNGTEIQINGGQTV